MQPVYRALEVAAKALVKATGTKITYQGTENIPSSGGAILAMNHTSYVDWLPAGLAAHGRGRRVRFMIKAEMTGLKSVNYLIKHTKAIPVNRQAGAESYETAVDLLRAGELVGMMPEATISRSFELKEFKTGAARMALDAQVPIIPLIVWGAQRITTKDHPKHLGRNKFPVTVAVGTALSPLGDVAELTATLQTEMTSLLHRTQQNYPHPDGAYWVPRRLGGSAPTPAEAAQMDARDVSRRAAAKAADSNRPTRPTEDRET